MSHPDLPTLVVDLGGPPAAPGTVYLVGGGPGDPGLISLRAARLLSTCDVVAYDRLAPLEAVELVPLGAERVCVGKRGGEGRLHRARVDDLLISRARDGQAVVRLKGGDPFVFGRGGEEATACRAAGIAVEVVPGVTSATAVPAAAGIPVTHRSVAAGFAVVAGHEDPAKPAGHLDHASLARFPGTLIVLMAVRNLRGLAEQLIAHGRDPTTPAALIRWGTTPRQETIEATLATIADAVERHGFAAPAVAVIGEVVRLRSRVGAPADPAPLRGVRVLVVRTLDRRSELAARIRALGGQAVEARVMETGPGDARALRRAVRDLAGVGAVVVSAPVAVDALADALAGVGLDARALAGCRLLAVGSGATRRLHERLAVRADLTAGTLQALGAAAPTGAGRVLLLAAAESTDRAVPAGTAATTALPEATRELAATLAAKGYQPEAVAAYTTRRTATLPEPVLSELGAGEIDLIALASSSSARHLADLLAGHRWRARVVSIGPQTSAAWAERGLTVDAQADRPDFDGLVDALVSAAGLEVPA